MVAMPPSSTWLWLVDAALREDLGAGDVTSEVLIPDAATGCANFEARENLVVAGVEVARAVLDQFDVDWHDPPKDGQRIEVGALLGNVTGLARSILAAERTTLNFLQYLSGIATQTHTYCEAIRGTRAQIVDTRKTLPGWRTLAKFAVACGGGTNHRMGLFDAILIKDNHIGAVGSVTEATRRAREHATNALEIQVEVESLADAVAAFEAGADLLLVDNQPPDKIREIVEVIDGRIPIEASGGVTLDTVRSIAETGVDRISIGALTHSVRAVDIALEWTDRSSN